MEAVALVNIALMLIAGLVSIHWLRDAVEVSRTRVTEMGPNTDKEAEQNFLELLSQAKTEIVMYDDGDPNDGSLYQRETVVQAVKQKIREVPGFQVRLMLNYGMGTTLFEQDLAGEPQVRIFKRSANPSRTHYKIIDDRKAYVSCHELGQTVRNRKLIDCTDALSRTGGHPLALRRYFTDFERHAA